VGSWSGHGERSNLVVIPNRETSIIPAWPVT
jgi:hypothetical protein